jgi:hypothetical protein
VVVTRAGLALGVSHSLEGRAAVHSSPVSTAQGANQPSTSQAHTSQFPAVLRQIRHLCCLSEVTLATGQHLTLLLSLVPETEERELDKL